MAKVFLVILGKCDHTYLISEISRKDTLDRRERSERNKIKCFRKCICSLSSQESLEPVKSKILSLGKDILPPPCSVWWPLFFSHQCLWLKWRIKSILVIVIWGIWAINMCLNCLLEGIKTVVKTSIAVHLHSQVDPWYSYSCPQKKMCLVITSRKIWQQDTALGGLVCLCRWSSKWHCNPLVFLFIWVFESSSNNKGAIYLLNDTLNAGFRRQLVVFLIWRKQGQLTSNKK